MIGFNIVKRLPKKPLLALAVLALALMAAGGGAAQHAQASSTTPYYIEVSYNTVRFDAIDDFSLDCGIILYCHKGNVYGTFAAFSASAAASAHDVRMISAPTPTCVVDWSNGDPANLACTRRVYSGSTNSFAEVPACAVSRTIASSVPPTCLGPYGKGFNKMVLRVYPDTKLALLINLIDRDGGFPDTSDDPVCKAKSNFTFTEAQLPRSTSRSR